MTRLIWKPAPEYLQYRPGHVMAETPSGNYVAGPRKSDEGWEYMTPNCEVFGEHEYHQLDYLTEEQAKAACEKHYEMRKILKPPRNDFLTRRRS